MRPTACVAALCALFPLTAQDGPKRLTVHEWGTFTVLQDERGEALPGVNINEESLPKFVHRLSGELAPDSHELGPVLNLGTHQRYASKGIPRSCPAARMRMETPIVYFYPGTPEPFEIDVRVDFYRGWISEWYPDARNDAPGFENARRAILSDRFGSVTWEKLTVGSKRRVPRTNSKVWVAPRIPAPATVATKKGEAERYLFYRGVADLPSPLRVERDVDGETLCVRANERVAKCVARFRYPALWLADVRADGRVAFRDVPSIVTGMDTRTVHARIPGRFGGSDYRPDGVRRLRKSMSAALQSAGLFRAEAKAMLDTWAVSYFKSPGLRLFFVMPREWIDAVLPLHLSRPANIERVMIGRVELITPAQRRLVQEIARCERASSPAWFHRELQKLPAAKRNETILALMQGQMGLADLELDVPADYRTYLKLGRFRDAIVLQEQRARPTPALQGFVRNYRLSYFQ